MKNFEKHIDEISDFIDRFSGCRECPCQDECFNDDYYDCKDFFKTWAMKEDTE